MSTEKSFVMQEQCLLSDSIDIVRCQQSVKRETNWLGFSVFYRGELTEIFPFLAIDGKLYYTTRVTPNFVKNAISFIMITFTTFQSSLSILFFMG